MRIRPCVELYEFLYKQNRIASPTCARCKTHNEDSHHILCCPEIDAQTQRNSALYDCLVGHDHERTSWHILTCLETELTNLIQIPSKNKNMSSSTLDSSLHNIITDAQHHPTILGWENALRGYTSKYYWAKIQSKDTPKHTDNKRKAPWNKTLVQCLVTFHKTIWNDRNTYINGKTIKENQQKL